MVLDYIFETKKRGNHKHEIQNDYYDDSYYTKKGYGKHEKNKIVQLLGKIKNNKKFKILFLVIILIAVIVIVGLIVFLSPLIIKAIDYINQHGVSGLFDGAIDFLNKL